MALSPVFHPINYPENSPLSHSALPVLYLPQVFEACDCLKLLSTHFDLCVDATGAVCHQLGLLGTDLHVEALSRHSTNFASSSSSPAKPDVISNVQIGDCSASNADSAFMIF